MLTKQGACFLIKNFDFVKKNNINKKINKKIKKSKHLQVLGYFNGY